MRLWTIALASLAAVATPLVAMPTRQELERAEGPVLEIMRPERDALGVGKKTRADVAKAAVAYAGRVESDAERMLLLKGAFTLYVRQGAFDKATDALRTLNSAVPDIPPAVVSNIVESAFRNMPVDKEARLAELVECVRGEMRAVETCVDMHDLTSVQARGLEGRFAGSAGLRRVDISGVETVGEFGMNDVCNGAGSLTTCLLNALTTVGGVNSQGGMARAFKDCVSITRVGDVDSGIPGKEVGVDLRSLVSVSEGRENGEGGMAECFKGCTGLVSVELPNLAVVGNRGLGRCFAGDTALVELSMPKLAHVGNQGLFSMCEGCTALETVNLSNLVSCVYPAYAFKNCKNLKKVYLNKLSSVVRRPSPETFYGCTSLEVVDFSEATAVPRISHTTFGNTNPTFKIVVPDALYDEWIAAKHWSDRASQIVKASAYTRGK